MDTENVTSSPAQVNAELAPYLNVIAKKLTGRDPQPLLDWIRELPPEKRYLWRIVAALRVGLGDFDSFTVEIDRNTLPKEKVREIVEELEAHEWRLKRAIALLRQGL